MCNAHSVRSFYPYRDDHNDNREIPVPPFAPFKTGIIIGEKNSSNLSHEFFLVTLPQIMNRLFDEIIHFLFFDDGQKLQLFYEIRS